MRSGTSSAAPQAAAPQAAALGLQHLKLQRLKLWHLKRSTSSAGCIPAPQAPEAFRNLKL
jgi:hypothetical protein